MKNRLKAILLSGAVLAATLGTLSSQALAQANPYAIPPKPPVATEVYDYNSLFNLIQLRKWAWEEFLLWNRLEPKVTAGMNVLPFVDKNIWALLNEVRYNTNLRLQTMETETKKIFQTNQKAEINIAKILDELVKYFNKPTGVAAAFSGKNKPIPYYDNAIDKAAREPVPNFDTLADDMRTKNTPPVTAYTPAMSQAITRYKLEDTIKFQPTLDPKNSLYVTRERRSHVASSAVTAFAVSEGTFKQASKSMERINTYIQAIKDSEDIKTSVDLNTRVMLEIVQQNNELLRSIAAMNSVNANYMMFNLGGK